METPITHRPRPPVKRHTLDPAILIMATAAAFHHLRVKSGNRSRHNGANMSLIVPLPVTGTSPVMTKLDVRRQNEFATGLD